MIVCVAALGLFFSGPIAKGERLSADRAATLRPAVEAEFNLLAYELQRLEIPLRSQGVMNVTMEIEGVSRQLELSPHSVFAADYQLLVQVADGSYEKREPGSVRTFRGRVVGVPESVVAGGFTDAGMTAKISIPGERSHWVEPLADRVAGAELGEHLVYLDEDFVCDTGECGVADDAVGHADTGGSTEDGSLRGGCGGGVCVAEVACDADVEYFNRYGSVAAVENRIAVVINAVNNQYEAQVGITHEIGTIIVRTAEPDPYSSTDAGTLLTQFINHWNAAQTHISRDVAHMFTGKNLQAPTIGIALLGTVCNRNSAYSLVESDTSSFFACTTDLSAHELGHNWNAAHCSCPSHTMNPSLVCANNFNPTFTIPTIVSFRDSRTCLGVAESGTTSVPLQDDFAETTLDPAVWTGIDGAVVSGLGTGEPSPPFSVNLDGSSSGGDQLRTGFMDMSPFAGVELSYWWQRTGGADSPEPGEDLIVEYLRDTLTWAEASRHPGAGSDTLPFAQATIKLPQDGVHAELRVRFRANSFNPGNDDWFIDDVDISGCFGATITEHPESQVGCPGGTAQFEVAATDPGPIEYQWFRLTVPLVDGGTVSGATTSTLTLSSLTPAVAGEYSCRVSNECGPLTSESADLVVVTTPATIVGQPDVLIRKCAGNTAFFTVTTEGTAPEYQWSKDGTPLVDDGRITGATAATLAIADATPADNGSYSCFVSDVCGAAEQSDDGELEVVSPEFTLEPQDTCAELGATAQFTAAATAPPSQTISWRWKKNGVVVPDGGDISGAQTDTLTIANVSADDIGAYSALAFSSNPVCLVDSAAGALTVGDCNIGCASPGDLDGDGDHDLGDMYQFLLCFGADVTADAECSCANVDDTDDLIDLDDWTALESLIEGPQ